jgi:hypothetical protein
VNNCNVSLSLGNFVEKNCDILWLFMNYINGACHRRCTSPWNIFFWFYRLNVFVYVYKSKIFILLVLDKKSSLIIIMNTCTAAGHHSSVKHNLEFGSKMITNLGAFCIVTKRQLILWDFLVFGYFFFLAPKNLEKIIHASRFTHPYPVIMFSWGLFWHIDFFKCKCF